MELAKKKKLGIAPSPAVVSENFQKAAQDLHAALEKPAPVATEADSKAAEFKSKKLVCSRGPTIEFKGKLLGEYSTDPQGKKTKWTELRLWETPSGKWIAESAGCSDEPGHVDIIDAHIIRGPVVLVERQTLKDFVEKTPQTLSMEFQAMEFWGWSSPAKALAKRLGWNLSITVE